MDKRYSENLAFSRPIATAKALGAYASDSDNFFNKRVLLTGEESILKTENGKMCFLDSLRLLARFVGNLTVWLPAGIDLTGEATHLAKAMETKQIEIKIGGEADFSQYDAILSVGTLARKDLPWVVINSNGWLARISSCGNPLANDCSLPNPIGALGAASLGASEVFKKLVAVKPERGMPFEHLVFSFHSYTVDTDPGPELPAGIELNGLLVGAGAIGNGILHLLRNLPMRGSMVVVDQQKFGEENLGTCILIGRTDLGQPKAKFAEAFSAERFKIEGYEEDVASFISKIGGIVPYPATILNALDNIAARRAVQEIWPDIIIDGAIGEFQCQASVHAWGSEAACLLCDFEETGANAEQIQSNATGLGVNRLSEPLSLITPEDVAAAPASRQEWLKERIGRQICSVVSEATIQKISALEQSDNFRPSVPFVACLSACMVVGEMIRHVSGMPLAPQSGYQFDVLVGPHCGHDPAHRRKLSCKCVQRKNNIDILRKSRISE